METELCLQALEMALQKGLPEIMNTYQGGQYASAKGCIKI
jgi:hypothetical protein